MKNGQKNIFSSTTKVYRSVLFAKTPFQHVRNNNINDTMRKKHMQIDLMTLSEKLVVTKWESCKRT